MFPTEQSSSKDTQAIVLVTSKCASSRALQVSSRSSGSPGACISIRSTDAVDRALRLWSIACTPPQFGLQGGKLPYLHRYWDKHSQDSNWVDACQDLSRVGVSEVTEPKLGCQKYIFTWHSTVLESFPHVCFISVVPRRVNVPAQNLQCSILLKLQT